MFSSLSSFSVFFFAVAAILLVGIIFEEKFLHLEDKFDDYIEKKKKQRRRQQLNKYRIQKNQNNNHIHQKQSHANLKKSAA